MPWEERLLDVRESLGTLRSCRIRFSLGPPWWVRIVMEDGQEREAAGEDLFECLLAIRAGLEQDGMLLCCQGARLDVHPSGMSRHSTGGRLAYRLSSHRKPTREDIVDIFDRADPATVGTVAAQQAEVERRFKAVQDG